MSKEMTLEEKYAWANKVAINAIKNLKDAAYAVYSRATDVTTCDKNLLHELHNPKVGDLVLELTSYAFRPSEFNNIGTLKEILPDASYVIETLDGDSVPWVNAKMIKIITHQR